MEATKSNSQKRTGHNVSDRVKAAYKSIKENKIVKAICVAVVAVAGLFAIGGLFRVLAWVTTGWNQLTAAFASK